jgi:hypothetical protein
MIQLDPETFTIEESGAYWRFWTTERLVQFDIAVMAGTEAFAPAPWALEQLGRELARIDALFDAALVAAKAGWAETYPRPAPEDGWTLTRIAIEENGGVTLTLYEGDIDTYGAWDVSMRDGAALGAKRRQI